MSGAHVCGPGGVALIWNISLWFIRAGVVSEVADSRASHHETHTRCAVERGDTRRLEGGALGCKGNSGTPEAFPDGVSRTRCAGGACSNPPAPRGSTRVGEGVSQPVLSAL